MEGQESQDKSLLAQSQGGNDVQEESNTPANIFDRIRLMGSSTVTSANEIGSSQLATSLQTITETMTAMKRDIDSLRSNGNQSEAPASKRVRISPDREQASSTASDNDILINNYLVDCQSEAPTGDTHDWLDVDEFFETADEMGEAISPDLATLANKVLRAKPIAEKSKLLASKHSRPQNVENLQVPRVDDTLWRQLKRETKSFDYAMQKTQSALCQATVPVLKMMQILKKEHVSPDVKELAGDTLKILAQSIVYSNEARMERIKRDLLPEYHPLCSNKPSATKLFGDKLQEDIKSLKESKATLTTLTSAKKPFLAMRGGAQHYQYNPYRNQGPANSSPRTYKPQRPSQYRNQQQAKRGKVLRKLYT